MPSQIVQPHTYAEQLTTKQQRLADLMQAQFEGGIEVFPSPPSHYRMRAEFRVWHDGDDIYCIMFDQDTREKIRIDSFPAGSKLINRLLTDVMAYVRSRPVLRHKLFQIEFLTTLSGQALISLIYHRQLEPEWQVAADELRSALHADDCNELHIVGRARKLKICVEQDFVEETLTIAGQQYRLQQVENSFTQPNAVVNQSMVEWALAATQESTGDLLELYCGNGNFSLPLAQNFDRVLATEISKTSVASAIHNCELNGIHNVTIVRMSAEDFSAALKGEKDSRRAKAADIHSFNCQTVLVDPPRAGLDDFTLEMVRDYQKIVYISCNPETLLNNIENLATTHKVEQLALFDQFPYTHHMEVATILVRR